MNGSLSGGAAGGRGSLQKRFSDQRAKLLELEYHDPFTTESLCLVERLFADLVTTTESYEDLTQREEQIAAELALSRAQLFPLKKENARLLRDNNLLHLKVIKATEEASAAERSSLLLGKRAETELEESGILGAQKDQRISDLERQVDVLRTNLASVLGEAEKRTGGGVNVFQGRRSEAGGGLNDLQREMEVSTPLSARAAEGRRRSAAGGPFDIENFGPEDDRLSGIVETLRERLEHATQSMAELQEERARLEDQVAAREREIERLGKQLGDDSNLEKVALAHAHEANQRIVEQLNDQVDFLNEQLALRETQLDKAREDANRQKSEPADAGAQVVRLQALARQMGEDNQRLAQRTALLERQTHGLAEDKEEETNNGVPLTAAGDGGVEDGATGTSEEATRRQSRLEREKEQLVEALSEAVQDRDTARERVGQAEKMVQEAMSEAERLRRLLGVADGAGDVGVEGASAAVRERDRALSDLRGAREEVHALQSEVARLASELESRTAHADLLVRERDSLVRKLEQRTYGSANETAVPTASATRLSEDRKSDGSDGGDGGGASRPGRASSQQRRVSFAEEDQKEFLAEEAETARVGLGNAERRARVAESRASEMVQEMETLRSALVKLEQRAVGAEGVAADARSAAVAMGGGAGEAETVGMKGKVESLKRKLEDSESSRRHLMEELERLAGQGSLLGVERSAQQARFDALERERISLSDDLKARERDVGALVEQKRSLEQELSRAQRALSRGAVESASIAQGELLLQARVEEMAEDSRSLRAEVDRLTDRLLAEEGKVSTARDEADRLSARLSHRSAGLEGLEAEAGTLRAELAVARTEVMEKESICGSLEADAVRLKSSVDALEQQLAVARENLSDKDQEVRRLKALSRQLEGSRESLKASSEQTHAALREAELRAGKAAAAGDASSRDAEAARAEVSQLKAALVDLDADRDRLQDDLDRQTEVLAGLRAEDERWRQRVGEAEERLREEGSRCSELEAALEHTEKRSKEAEENAADCLRRMEAFSSQLEQKTGQLAAATEDLEMMAKENQAITADLTRLSAEQEDGRRRLGDALHKAATAEQAARAAQFEKEDVLKNYRGLHAEKRRLEAGVDELQLTRQRLTKSLAERDSEVTKLRASCTALEIELQRKTIDIGATQRQAENLSEQLRRCGRQVEALASENRKLAADGRAQRHHANTMLERIRSQQGHSAMAVEEVNSLRARLQALEEERDGLAHILGRERSHGTGLEQLIEASRLREASVAAEQRQLAREKDRLQTKANRLAEELAQARDCVADLSSRVSAASPSSPLQGFSGVHGNSSSSNSNGNDNVKPAPGAFTPAPARRDKTLDDTTNRPEHVGDDHDSPALTDTSAAAAAAARATAAMWNRRDATPSDSLNDSSRAEIAARGALFGVGRGRSGWIGGGGSGEARRIGMLVGGRSFSEIMEREGSPSAAGGSTPNAGEGQRRPESQQLENPRENSLREESKRGGIGVDFSVRREGAGERDVDDDDNSGLFDLDDVRGFVRRESLRLRETVLKGGTRVAEQR